MMHHLYTGEAVVTTQKLTFFGLSPRGLQRTQDNQNVYEIVLVSLAWKLGSPW